MTPDQATDLAARVLTAINRYRASISDPTFIYHPHRSADRERVASDLAGLNACFGDLEYEAFWGHEERYADGLRRTAALYGVEP